MWADTFFFFAFGVGVSVGSAGVSILPGGDWEGRYLNLPSAMILFQLVVFPCDNFGALSPAHCPCGFYCKHPVLLVFCRVSH